mgnify:CR=1 FL=1
MYDLITKIYSADLKSGKPLSSCDPVDEYVAKQFGTGRFPSDPVHTLTEWTALLKESIGADPGKNIFMHIDPVDNFVALQLGRELPSARTLSVVMDKIMDAGYQLGYKLTPGTKQYSTLDAELKQLQTKRKELENNIKEISK